MLDNDPGDMDGSVHSAVAVEASIAVGSVGSVGPIGSVGQGDGDVPVGIA